MWLIECIDLSPKWTKKKIYVHILDAGVYHSSTLPPELGYYDTTETPASHQFTHLPSTSGTYTGIYDLVVMNNIGLVCLSPTIIILFIACFVILGAYLDVFQH